MSNTGQPLSFCQSFFFNTLITGKVSHRALTLDSIYYYLYRHTSSPHKRYFPNTLRVVKSLGCLDRNPFFYRHDTASISKQLIPTNTEGIR